MKLPPLPLDLPTPIRHWGEELHRLADASGIRSQLQLAKQLHVGRATLHRYLTCARLPDDKLVSRLIGLAQASDTRLDTLAVQHAYNDAAKAFAHWPPRHRNGQVAPSALGGDPEPTDATEQRVSDDHQAGDGPATARRPVVAALATSWTWVGRLPARWKVVAVGAALVAVAVLVVLLIRPWGTSNELDGPRRLPLLRYQAPTPDRANFISPIEPGPASWIAMPALGEVYAPGESRLTGLVPIYRYRCTNCGEALVYFLSRDASPRSSFELEGEAFRCFDPHNPPPGTRPLQSLSNRYHARLWAIPGTSEYRESTANGFKDPNPGGLPLCYIW